MKKYKKITSIIVTACALLTATSCTDLGENMYHEYTTDNFYNNKTEVLSAVLRPYTHSRAIFGQTSRQNCWKLNELSADQLAWPVKGQHGFDDGKWIQLHYHTWTDMHNSVKETWNLIFSGLGYCNDAIINLQKRTPESMGITEAERLEFVAELRANRAYYYLNAINIFGNVPIVTAIADPLLPPTNSRKEVFDFIESELLAIINELPEMTFKNVGRFTKVAGYAMLADLYLNAEAWTGTARWDDCITYCNKVVAGEGGSQHGTMALDPDLLVTYCNQNTEKSNENILVLSYDNIASGNKCDWGGDFFHFNQRYIYGGASDGNDGVVVIPTAYDAFAGNDLRKKEWMLIGIQYRYDNPTIPVEGKYEYNGQPLEFVKDIKRLKTGETESTMYTGEENSGARFNKYRTGALSDVNYWNNDWVLYRLTEIYFMKAESLMRKNGNTATQAAVDLINDCRKRAFTTTDWATAKYTTTTLTMDELLVERGREFIFEGKRRTDLIRFNKFLTGTWWDHAPTNSEHLKLYPIPYSQTSLNSNLVQNPGYNSGS